MGFLHAVREVAVGGAVRESARRGGAVGRVIGSRVVGAARGPLSAVGIGSWARPCGAIDSLAAARVGASGDGRVGGRGG